jgi:diguanylate cyclase (GGDEF)-like protein/PAS domain S-box-containing protein
MIVDRDENEILRVQAQQAALFSLLKGGIPTAVPGAAWPALTEALASTLGIRRASIWLFSGGRSILRLAHEHDASGHPRAEAELEAAGYPEYFKALLGNRTIVAPDAVTDPRTVEFSPYFKQDNVVSLLDAGIWRAGQAIGVVCAETVGERRDWSTDEQLFAGSIADLAAAVLDHENLDHARAALEESQDLFSRALNSSPDWITVVRMSDGVMLHVNEAFEQESGYSGAEVLGRSTLDLGLWAHPEQRRTWIESLNRDGVVREHEVEFRKKDGTLRTFSLSGHRVEVDGALCVVTTSRDITDRRRHERLVQEIASGVGAEVGESFFRSLVEHLSRLLKADLAFVGEVVRREVPSIRTIAAAGDSAVMADQEYGLDGTPSEAVLADGVSVFAEGVARHFPRDQALATRGIEGYVGAPLVDARGQALGVLAVLFKRRLEDPMFTRDLLRIFATRASAELERQQHFRAVHHLAHHDSLTGLPNRLRIRQRLEDDLTALNGTGKHGALLLIDLDRFKEVNDTLGHHVGDRLLARVAQRLDREMKRFPGGEVARLGGDEFAIWLPDVRSPEEARLAAARAHAAAVAPIEIDGLRLELGASMGIALAPDHSDNAGGLMRCADVAMYAAKERHQGHVLYDAALDPYTHERLVLLSELAGAVRKREIVVHFQPRVRLADGALGGFEALARWNHPRLGLLPPARFIPLAELSDVIAPLTLLVLDTALAKQSEWGPGVKVSVNLSARHLLDERCAAQVKSALEQHRTEPGCLELEITESALIHDPDRARHALENIAAHGVRISIDDFGTGYSSLSHLRRLPLNALKIDSSFVRPMLSNAADRTIVASTVALARNLGLAVAAEGIEDAATLEALRAMDCDEGQGFHIARPMESDAALRWVREHPAARLH